jgi:hypothetical protein
MKNQNFLKNDLMMSDINDMPFSSFKQFREDFKEDRSNEDSNMTFLYQSKYFRSEGKKKNDNDSDSNTENHRNYKTINLEEERNSSDDESMICIKDLDNDDIDNCEEDKKENEIEIKSDSESEDNYKFNLNSAISFSYPYELCKSENNLNELFNVNRDKGKKIFKIVKVERYRDLPHKKRRGRGKYKSKKNDIDWENIITPKEKHFHLDRKKKRIVFQRKHLKMIYSIANLPYPFNFKELYKLIDEHVGDKTVNNYGNKKSYHIIKINGQTIITTMKEKKDLLGRKVKPKKND